MGLGLVVVFFNVRPQIRIMLVNVVSHFVCVPKDWVSQQGQALALGLDEEGCLNPCRSTFFRR
mgnify:CR=1 FL=1